MSRHDQRKLSKVCNEESYKYLQEWIIKQNPNMPYPMDPMQYFYSKTNHRQYLSKWIEAVISKVLKSKGADPQKANDAGTYRDNTKIVTDIIGIQRKIGSGNWTKTSNVKPGRADITCFFKGRMLNLEVKVGNDKMSDLQKIEEIRAKNNNEEYIIIKTIEDFLILLQNGEDNFRNIRRQRQG